MSNTALTHVWNNSKAKGSALLVMIAIADMANDDGDCWPGRTNLAKKCRMTKRYLQKLTAQLVALGELEILENEGVETSHGKTNRYKVTGVINRSSLDTDGVSYSSPHTDNGVNRSSSQGVNYDSPKPSIEPSVKEQPSEKTLAPAARKQQPKKRKSNPKPRDPVYDMVAEVWFQKQYGTAGFNALGGRIGQHVTWLKGNEITVKRKAQGDYEPAEMITVPGCKYEITRGMLAKAKQDWFKKYPGINAPTDILKFVEWIDEWMINGQEAEPSKPKVHFPPGVRGCDMCNGTGMFADSNLVSKPCPKCLEAEAAQQREREIAS